MINGSVIVWLMVNISEVISRLVICDGNFFMVFFYFLIMGNKLFLCGLLLIKRMVCIVL